MSNLATLKTIAIGLIALTALIFISYLVTPPADRISAQDGGTGTTTPVPDANESETTPATTGELVVVPSEVQKGQTTLAVGFHVVPFDLEVEIRYSGHFTPEDESCDNAGTAGSTQAAAAPTWITLNACTVGEGYVRMVESATGNVIKEVSVTVIQPGVTGQQARTTVTISGLASTELVPGGSGDRFSVSVAGLEGHKEYNLHTVVLNSLSAAFNSGCTRFRETDSIVGLTSATESYTVYGCVAPGNSLWSYVEEMGGRAIASSGVSNNPVNVKNPTVSFSESSYSVVEGSDSTITVELSHRSSDFIGVPINVTNGTAESTDYDVDGLSSTDKLNFNSLSKSESFKIKAKDDDDFDDETVNLRFGTLPSTVSGTGSRSRATLTIDDDDEVNRDPDITSGPSTVSYGECRTGSVGTYRATDPDGDPITWSLLGTDEGDFDISSGGVLTFDDTPDYEDPDDSNDDNIYKVTVRASDDNGGSDDRDVTVTVTNRAPSISSGRSSVSYAEGGTGSVATYRASDPCGGTITWSLPNTTFEIDRNDFNISSNGVLTFDDTPDYEDPDDSNDDNIYKVTVRASDGSLTADRNVTVTVTNLAPTITSGPSSVTYAEGGTGSVATYRASDPGGGNITWSLPNTTFETDRTDFTISSGILTFKNPPNYESPHDSNQDNVYRITVRASDDSGSTADRNVTITVTDVNERPEVASPIADQTMTASVSRIISLQGRFSDPDTNDTLSYSASSSNTGVATASVSGDDLTIAAKTAGSATITVTAADRASGHADRLTVSDSFTVTVEPNAPAKVTGLTGTPGSVRGTIDLDWDPADRADDYEVAQWRQRVFQSDHWVVLDSTEVTIDTANSSAVVKGLTGGETYKHRVRGIKGTGSARVEGEWSDEAETTLTLPGKVTGLTGAPGTDSREIDLNWNADNDATGYQVRQREHHRIPRLDNWTVLPTVFTGTSATVTSLDPEKTYVYQVRGWNLQGEGEWSDATPEIAVRPDTPTGLNTEDLIGGRGIKFEWGSTDGADGYEVEISPSASSHRVVPDGDSVKVTGLTPGTTYSFNVRAWHMNAGSRWQSPWPVAVNDVAPTPKNSRHQADHRVKYVEGTIGNRVVEHAIPTAVSEWNSEMNVLGKGLEICTGRSCNDSFTVTIKTVNKNNRSTVESGSSDEGCDIARACVKSVQDLDHKKTMYMIFEDPPWNAKKDANGIWQHKEFEWNAIKARNGVKVPGSGTPGKYYVYGLRIVLHEFGHTLGLPDFYGDTKTDLDNLIDAVMHTGYEIHEEDIEQLRAIYLLHNPH